MILTDIISDGLFAAVAAIGFGAISDPPMRAFPSIAALAAIGHALRFCLMTYLGVDYKTVFALIMFMQNLQSPELQHRYLLDLCTNGIVAGSVIFMLAVGATMPLFLFKSRAFSMTRHGKKMPQSSSATK